MRRLALLAVLIALMAPGIATAKLPFFGLQVTPLRPGVGDSITITMTCYLDEEHTRARSSCFGDSGVMAWVHPLDDDGRLERTDWIPVEGNRTSTGATRGRITLDEAGSYDVLALWRTWGPDHSEGFPSVIRIEVTGRERILRSALAAFGLAATCFVVARRRRSAVSL